MKARTFAAALVILLLTVACGSTSESPESAAPSPAAPGEALAEEPTEDGGSDEDSAKEDKEKDKDSSEDGKPTEEKGEGGGNGDSGGTPSASDGGSGPGTSSDGGGGSTGSDGTEAPEGGSSPAGDGKRGGGTAARRSPLPGDYVYNQSGYEKFCAGGCSTEKLPPRQTVKTSIPSSSRSADVVVTEARSSGGRMARTTSRYSKGSAHITEVYVRFAYSGYTFEQTYRPQPAVQSLRFPLRAGDSWNGSWKGKVSGTYSVSVIGREAVSAAGRNVQAMKVQTKTSFKGDFSGKANATMWIDPRTRAVLRTAGNLHVASTYGSYETGFATSLRSGPGY